MMRRLLVFQAYTDEIMHPMHSSDVDSSWCCRNTAGRHPQDADWSK
jgi:hypothetical protein